MPRRASGAARLRELPGPLRVADLPAYLGALDFAPSRALCRTLPGMPMRHRGADVGSFVLGAKEGAPAFTDEDEEVSAELLPTLFSR